MTCKPLLLSLAASMVASMTPGQPRISTTRQALAIDPLIIRESPRKTLTLDWAEFPVEMEKFSEAEPGKYANVGTFSGVGNMYLSVSRKLIELKGLRVIEIPFLGQEIDDKYEFRFESFTIESVIPTGAGEYAFQAINNGRFARKITGKIRLVPPQGLGVSTRVEEFLMEEHGQAIEGVMNRYVLPRSVASKAMLKKYDEVFFGGNFVALDIQR
jgi:hypothetical protein